MMVANSFDLWQKDAFFSAAEEVQESADVMESAYRMWIRERREGLRPEDLNELSKELQTTLGTAKWQLEEFERAVRLSHGHRSDDITASRHNQFVVAIESQISRIEAALRESLSEEGKQPLQWVNLEKEECDDLAMFLSGVFQTPQVVKDDTVTLKHSSRSPPRDCHHKRKDADSSFDATCSKDASDRTGFLDVGTSSRNSEFIISVEEKDVPGLSGNTICQTDNITGARRTWSSPNFAALKIVIPDEDGHKDTIMLSTDTTPKEKGSKSLFWKLRCGDNPRLKRSVNHFSQSFSTLFSLMSSGLLLLMSSDEGSRYWSYFRSRLQRLGSYLL